MSEVGFYHPSWGYWQTTDEPSTEIRATYPQGTVQVPLKPGANYNWQNGAWVPVSSQPAVPDSVQRGQARHILGRSTLSNGVLTIHEGWQSPSLLTQVDALCAAAGGETADIWQNLIVLRRDSPMLNGVGETPGLRHALGLTPAHLDTLFIAAAQVAL